MAIYNGKNMWYDLAGINAGLIKKPKPSAKEPTMKDEPTNVEYDTFFKGQKEESKDHICPLNRDMVGKCMICGSTDYPLHDKELIEEVEGFYMVVVTGSIYPPTEQHKDFDYALGEATRLSKKENKTAYVLKAVAQVEQVSKITNFKK